MSDVNISLVQSIYAAFGRGDVPTILEALAPDVDWQVNGRIEDYPLFGGWKGRERVRSFLSLVAETEDFLEFTPREFHVAGDKVFVTGRCAGTIRRTRRPFVCEWIHIFGVRDGKVAMFREFTDTAQFAEAYNGV